MPLTLALLTRFTILFVLLFVAVASPQLRCLRIARRASPSPPRRRAMLALLAASCQGFVAVRSVAPRTAPLPRVAAPQANLFDTLGKIAEYNKNYFGTMAAGMMDGRTARASHVLFGYAKYEKDGEKRAADLKLALDSGEITFADAAKASALHSAPSAPWTLGTLHPRHRMTAHHTARCIATWCTTPRRAYPPRSSRRARARPRAATWARSSEERWCPSSTAPSSTRRPRSAACHVHGVCMVCVEPLRSRAESLSPQPLTDSSPSTRRLGAICGPIKTQFGYHLLQVVERSEKSA